MKSDLSLFQITNDKRRRKGLYLGAIHQNSQMLKKEQLLCGNSWQYKCMLIFFYYAWFSSKIVSFLFRLLCLLYNNFTFATAAASVFILKPFDIAKIVMFSLTIFFMLLFIPIMWWQSTRSNHFTVYIYIFLFLFVRQYS